MLTLLRYHVSSSFTRQYGMLLPWLVGALAALLLGVSMAGTSAVHGQSGPREMTFYDTRNQLALTFQVVQGTKGYGNFVLRVPGYGNFVGNAASGTRVNGPTSIVIHYEGPATLRPIAEVASRANGSVTEPRQVTIRLQAHLNPDHHTAEATLWHGTDRYHLVAPITGRGAIETTLKTFENAELTGDWALLYSLLNTDLTAAYTQQQFVQESIAQASQVGRTIVLKRVSVSDVTTADIGATYFVATYDVQTQLPNGTTKDSRQDIYFVRQNDAWKLWFGAPQ